MTLIDPRAPRSDNLPDRLSGLRDEIRRRLRDHPSEAAQRCAAALAELDFTQPSRLAANSPALCRHLTPALAASPLPIAALLADVWPALAWESLDNDAFPLPVGRHLAIVRLVGPDSMFFHPDLRIGLYLQAPRVFYPNHSHAAEELYYVISGAADWRVADQPPRRLPAGGYSWHRAWDSHAMETHAEPLVAVWTWTGNIDLETYRMDTPPAGRPHPA